MGLGPNHLGVGLGPKLQDLTRHFRILGPVVGTQPCASEPHLHTVVWERSARPPRAETTQWQHRRVGRRSDDEEVTAHDSLLLSHTGE